MDKTYLSKRTSSSSSSSASSILSKSLLFDSPSFFSLFLSFSLDLILPLSCMNRAVVALSSEQDDGSHTCSDFGRSSDRRSTEDSRSL